MNAEFPWLQHALALVLASHALACGGSSSESDDAMDENDPRCADEFNGPIDPSALIDDLEDGNGAIRQVGGRNGSWWISTDATDGQVTPEADAAPPAERILGGRCQSEYAMRITGSDFTEWGAVLSLGFRYDEGEKPVDISDFRGVTFWARVGETNSSNLRIQFQDSTTHVAGGKCTDEEGAADGCWDGWGTEVSPLSSDWQLYEIRFSTLSQRDFGLQGEELDLKHAYGIDFNLDPNSVFDIWLDDLWFFD